MVVGIDTRHELEQQPTSGDLWKKGLVALRALVADVMVISLIVSLIQGYKAAAWSLLAGLVAYRVMSVMWACAREMAKERE